MGWSGRKAALARAKGSRPCVQLYVRKVTATLQRGSVLLRAAMASQHIAAVFGAIGANAVK